MGSNQTLRHTYQVRDSCSGYFSRRGYSTSQMCLQKILSIISSIPHQEYCLNPQISGLESEPKVCDRGFSIDLNLGLSLSLMEGEGESESLSSGYGLNACGFGRKVVQGGSTAAAVSVESLRCPDSPAVAFNDGGGGGGEVNNVIDGDKAVEHLEIQSCEIERTGIYGKTKKVEKGFKVDGEEGKDKMEQLDGGLGNGSSTPSFGRGERTASEGLEYKSNDCLGLLVEAARLISGDFSSSDDEFETESEKPPPKNRELSGKLENRRTSITGTEIVEPKTRRSKRKAAEEWMVVEVYGDIEMKSPIVKSKRGRNQALPCRYRDSVLEPWRPKRMSNKVSSRQRRSRW